MKMAQFWIGVILFGTVTAGAGYLVGLKQDKRPGAQQLQGSSSSADRKILYYRNPMGLPDTSPVPKKDSMGMDYIPVYESDLGGQDERDSPIVTIPPEVMNNLGVRTETVNTADLWREINTVGYIDLDESKISHVHLRTEGWIHNLTIDSEGERVKKGELLFTLYSPLLVNAQEEFIQALAGNSNKLITASRERLYSLGLTKSQLDQLEKSRKAEQHVATYAPQSGFVFKLLVRHGMYVKPENEVMALANLDTVWLLAEVFERQANWVRIGQTAEASLPSMPGEVMQGKVDYIYPDLDPKTRTLRVRMRFNNSEGILMPNMYAHVVIHGEAMHDVLYVPREAIIREESGERVILSLGAGRFKARPVVAGIESGNRVEIKSGLEAGDVIVISAQFLIDSESSLKASLQRMEPRKEQSNVSPVMKQNPDSVEGEDRSMPVDNQIMAAGTVRSVDKDTHKLKITHDPIKELNWPVMTMDFIVADDVPLEEIRAGDMIHFGMKKSEADQYIISMIHVMKHSSRDEEND